MIASNVDFDPNQTSMIYHDFVGTGE